MNKDKPQGEISGRPDASACNELLERRLVLSIIDEEPEVGWLTDDLRKDFVMLGGLALPDIIKTVVQRVKSDIRNRVKAL